ncbi:helix-turn-helix domain-containing protein [Clostridioides difficile]
MYTNLNMFFQHNNMKNVLKSNRKSKKLTQNQLSKLANISQSYISDLEKEYFVHSPTVKQIISLSKALSIEPRELAEYFIEKEIESK